MTVQLEVYPVSAGRFILRQLLSKPTHLRSEGQLIASPDKHQRWKSCDKMANGAENKTHTESQVYLSTRGGDYDVGPPRSLSVFLDDNRYGVLIFRSCHSRPLSSRASQPTGVSSCRIRFQPQTNGYVRNNSISHVALCDRLFYNYRREPMAKTDFSASGKISPTPNWPLRFSASTSRDPRSLRTI